MAAFNLGSLVLRGVAVLRDVSVVGSRLGGRLVANRETPTANPTRHPFGYRTPASAPPADTMPAHGPGAGRSLCAIQPALASAERGRGWRGKAGA